ncbi:MAG TPA: glycosyltransferase [Jatrophihabitans sp.]|nr:glycosyltransferase [Jatrophihabitans sp.]
MSLYQARTPGDARSLLPDNGRPVVVVPVFNSYDEVVRCYEAFFRNTPVDVPLLVVDDKGWDRRPFTALSEIFAAATAPEHRVVVLEQMSNKGFLGTMNDAFAAAGRADVVILNSDVVVGPEWLERMHDAAYSSTTVATVTALTNHGTIVSVPTRNVATDDVPGGLSVDEAARRVAAGSPKLRPRIPTAIGHCTYVRRTVMDVIGYFDPAFAPGYGEEVDFSQRAVAAGFENIVADDVYVFHKGGSSFGRSPAIEKRKFEHEQIIQNRYPYYGPWVRRTAEDDFSPLAASLLAARRSVLGLVVAVDGLCLGPLPAGTQIGTVATICALADRDEIREVIVYTPEVVPEYARSAFEGYAKVTVRPVRDLDEPLTESRAHVVFRPYQVRDAGELEWLRMVADRVVVNQLDFIAYHDAAYFARDEQWRRYRDLNRLTAFAVDGMAYISEHSRDAAAAEGLLPLDRPAAVIYNGVDHTNLTPDAPVQPANTGQLDGGGFLLVLGVSYLHKNRLFALRMLTELVAAGWSGSLVLAGAEPPDGSSVAAEARYLIEHPEIADRVVQLGIVSDAEKNWLYQQAGLVLYPTTSEGFGLVPFEAAHLGVPCLSTRMGGLDEVLPRDIPTIDTFDPAAAATTARRILDDPSEGERIIKSILAHAADFTWDRVAQRLVELFTDVTARPANRVLAIAGEQDAVGAGAKSFSLGGSTARGLVDSAVGYFVARPALRVKLVPPGSARQAAVRKGIDAVRRRI